MWQDLKLNLHDIYSNERAIKAELSRVIMEVAQKRIELVEIIPGKGSGQLKKSLLSFFKAAPR